MLKKNSWIVALLLALSLTAFLFTGCVSPLKVEEDTETYEEYPLDKGYNAWAGQVYQKGWAIGGIKFQGKGDAIVVAKDLGYDIEMFQKATKLKIEMPDASYPRSGVDIIWGGEDESGDSTKGGGMWNQQPIAGGSGDVDATFAKKDGNVLIIDLTKALKNYSTYTKAAKLKIVLQVNAPSYGDVEGLVQKAYLMIPSTPLPYVGITNMTLVKNTMLWTNELALTAKFTPDNATEQAVTWAIKSFRYAPVAGGSTTSIGLPDLNLDDPRNDPTDPDHNNSSIAKYEAAKKALFAMVSWKQEVYTVDDTIVPAQTAYRSVPGTLAAPGQKAGTLTLVATVKNGKAETGSDKDYVKELTVTISDPAPLYYKLNGVDKSTIYYDAVENLEQGGTMVLEAAGADGKIRGFTSTFSSEGYGNSYHYFMVDLGSEKLSNYKGIRFHYEGLEGDCDLVGKNNRFKAMAVKPPKSYNPGPNISTFKIASGDGKNVDVDFEFFKDNAGAWSAGGDLTSADTNAENSVRYNDIDSANKATVSVKDANVVYLWFSPWATGKGMKFTITDIELYK